MSNLSARNVITSVNSSDLSVIRYSGCVVEWTKEKQKDLNTDVSERYLVPKANCKKFVSATERCR